MCFLSTCFLILKVFFWYDFYSSQVAEELVQRDGDFLIRDSLSSPGNFVLTCQWKNTSQHFKINRTVLRLSEAYCRVQYQLELESFDSIPGLVRYHVGNRTPVSKQSGAIIFQPINRTVPLRCLEEKYGVTPVRQKEPSISEGKPETAKRLSLGVSSMQSPEQSIPRGNLLRYFNFAVLMEENVVTLWAPAVGDVNFHSDFRWKTRREGLLIFRPGFLKLPDVVEQMLTTLWLRGLTLRKFKPT